MSDRMEENSVYKVAHSTGRSLSASLSVQLFGSQKSFKFNFRAKMAAETFNLKSLEDCLKAVPEGDLRDLKAAIYGRPDE